MILNFRRSYLELYNFKYILSEKKNKVFNLEWQFLLIVNLKKYSIFNDCHLLTLK